MFCIPYPEKSQLNMQAEAAAIAKQQNHHVKEQ